MLQITMLGCLHLRDDQAEQETLAVGSERSQALLAYLLLHRTSPQPRQQIAGHLWPDLPESEAKKSLRRELYRLRQLLPMADDCLHIEPKTLQWAPVCPYGLDVEEFELSLQRAEAAAQRGDLQLQQDCLTQVTALYRGALLPTCYDDWIQPLREQFHQQAVLALDQLTRLLLQRQDHVAAQPLALQLLQMEPLHEGSYQALMQSYQACGNRAAALQVYHQCMTLLREELGIDPSPATQQLYQQALNTDEETTGDGARVPPKPGFGMTPGRHPKPQRSLVGRTAEKQVIQTWLTQMDQAGKVLLLVGEPGIGKTRLLEELMVLVPEQTGAVLSGRGFEAEMLRPYGVWIDALRGLKLGPEPSLPPELGLLLPELGTPAEPLSDRGRLFDTVITLLGQLANQYAPLVVIFDDIQWLDEASVSLLHYGIRLLRSAPVRFACSARRQELKQNPAVSSLVQTLQRDQRLQRLEVEALDKAAVLALIQTMDASINGDRIYRDSGGNPLFALEAVRAFHQQGQVDLSTLQALIANRLQGLEPNAQSLLPWAAALGRQFEPMRLAQVTDSALIPLLTALEQLEAAGIIRPSAVVSDDDERSDGQGYDFAHDVLRQVVYESISAPRRQLMHCQIARHLHQTAISNPTLMGEVAHHASLGQNHDLAAEASLHAAQQGLQLFAYVEVAELAQRGLRHCQHLPTQRRLTLQLPLLNARVLAGVQDEKVPVLIQTIEDGIRKAQDLGLQDAETAGLEALLLINYHHNRWGDLHQYSLQAAERGSGIQIGNSARILAMSGSCLTTLGQEMDRAEAMLLEAQSLSARVGLRIPDVACGLGNVARFRGHLDRARDYYALAYDWGQEMQTNVNSCLNLCLALTGWAMTELEARAWQAAIARCQALIPITEKTVVGSNLAFARALNLLAYYSQVPDPDPAALATAVDALKRLDAPRKLAYVLSGAAEADLTHGKFDTAVAHAAAALEFAQVVAHPSDVVLAGSLLVRAKVAAHQNPDLLLWQQHQALASAHDICDRAAQSFAIANHLHQYSAA